MATPYHILVVDDDISIQESMLQFIKLSQYTAHSVSSADEALTYITSHSVDVVITDIVMPGMSGLDLTDRIKKEFDIDVIVMTGYREDYSYENVINRGASDIVFKPVRYTELLLRLKRVIRERELRLERAVMLKKLENLSITDGLTHLYNSRHFFEQLDKEIDRHHRYLRPLSLLLMDIDHFKACNDTHGHLEGDKVLVRLGAVIKKCLRTNDTGYRYGGEEFTILLPETSLDEACIVSERIQETLKLEEIVLKSGDRIHITLSVGVTEYQSGEDAMAFVRRADKAMYMSKLGGRNQITSLQQDSPEKACGETL